MIKRCGLIFCVSVLALVHTACQRSRIEVWEDAKTCSRYMGKGFRTFLGNRADPYYTPYEQDFQNGEFLALSDSDTYDQFSFSDFGKGIEEEVYTLTQESPGDPGSSLPSIENFQDPVGKNCITFSNIHFPTDKYDVQGRENIEALQAIAKHLRENRHMHVFIEGHADERGPAAYNLALGSKRANSIRSFLIQNGVNADQLFTISYGKERPLVMGHDEASWGQNRRAQFKLYER